ncbi:hypothetical protein [Streptosporangium roseum]|uniref:Uncharacterized protein n=1 Tax=Streptosporangium roseum (strain ATCC 12428 / DSM 43021 / JCM 3005 / KCTC 9067 / NCIMB 10171 / NRRL 2505 / NI 9100) TaxID=479432 RepID=D2AU46_STRRD|nr:hypothetical protein [Streptosporangium roseum]ACZ88701.1 hypothetical protein Sros_5966 [Streptosporangium roseum DSM 43021]
MRLFRRHRDRQTNRHRDRQAERPSRPVEEVDLDSLLALVADSLGYTCSFAPDGGTLTLSGPRRIVVRLTGLHTEARRRSREDWPMLVSEHLSHALATVDEPFDACDLDQVRPLLRTRIRLDDDLGTARVVGRHLSTDLVEVLTVGHGAAGRPVRPEEAGCWPITAAQALDLAAGNARGDEPLSVAEADLGGVAIRRLSGPTVSAAAHLRCLDDYLIVPADGVLVVLPDPATLVVHAVEGIGVVRAIERLRLFAQREFDRGAGALSPQVYWWHDGRLTLIRADLVSQEGQTRLVVAPPPEFARVLAALAVRPDGGTGDT